MYEEATTVKRKLAALISALCLVLGVATSSALAADSSVSYGAKWVDGGVQISVTAPVDGTAYYVVADHSDSATMDTVDGSNGTALSCTANTTATANVATSSTGAQDIFVQFHPTSGSDTYSVMKMTLPAKTGGTSNSSGDSAVSGSVSFNVTRPSATTVELSVTPTLVGKAYYIVQDAGDTAPSMSDVEASENYVDCTTANSTTTEDITVDDASAKTIYVMYQAENGTWFDEMSTLTVPAYESSSVNYSAGWTDSTHLFLTVNPTDAGTAYYVVQEQGSTAPSVTDVMNGSQLTCTAGSDNTAAIDVTTQTAKTIYIVYQETDGSTYSMSSLTLPAYASGESVVDGNATTIGSVSLKAERTSTTTIKLDATPTIAGTVHYIVQDTDADAPSLAEVLASDNTIVCDTANATASTTITTDEAAKKIYVAFETADGLAFSTMDVMEVPTYGSSTYGAEILEYDPNFNYMAEGYSTVQTKTFTIKNTGSIPLTFTVKSGSDDFTTSLDGTSLTVAAGETGTFTISTKTGLSAGEHNATITLSGATSDGTEVLTLDVPVSFLVTEEEITGEYYCYWTNDLPWALNDTATQQEAVEPVYCINLELWVGPYNYPGRILFNEHSNVTADQFKTYAGNAYLYNQDTGTYTYYKADADGDGNLEVATAEETLENVKRVLNNGYGGAHENQTLRSYVEECIGLASLSGDDADLAFYLATQAAVWHYTDYSSGSTTDTVKDFDDYMNSLEDTNNQAWRWWNLRPRIHKAVTAIYDALIDEDGTFETRTLGINTFPGGTLVMDTSDVEANVYVNALDGSSYTNGHYQNLISSTGGTSENETTSVSMTKIWNDGGTSTASGRPSATEFASWVHLYANGSEVSGYTPTVTNNQNGTYTVTYSGLPLTDSDGNTLSYSIVEEIPSDSSYSAEYGSTSGSANETVTGEYVAHTDETALPEGMRRIWMSDPDFGDDDQVVYCFNLNDGYPDYDGAELDGTTYTTKITNATNEQFKQYADGESVDDLRSAVLSVIYNGYPTNAAGLQGSLTDDQFRAVTQLAIYYFTDGLTYNSSDSFDSTEEYDVYEKLISGESLAAVPDNYGLTLYVSSDGHQNLLSATGSSSTVTNTKLTSVEFTKNWTGSDGTGKTATIHLYRSVSGGTAEDTGLSITVDGTADTTLTTGADDYANVTYGEDSEWHGTFNDLPAFDSDGNAYTYTITEDTVDGFYEPIISGDTTTGFTVTNISNETRDIRVTKTWKGTAEPVTVNLLADGEQIYSVTLDGTVDSLTTDETTGVAYGEASKWVASFGYLPKYDETDGHEIVYTVDEDSIDGVTTAIGDATEVSSTVTEYAITNTRTGTVQPTVTKSWAEGVDTDEVTLQLQRYDTSTSAWVDVDGETVTLNGTEDGTENWSEATDTTTGEYAEWQGRFGAVDKYDADGNEYSYQVVETTTGEWVPSYSGTLSTGFTVTNNAQGSVSATLSAKKTLNDNAPGDYSFTFNLYQADENGTISDETPIQSVKNSSTGAIEFNALSFSSTGDYYYVIQEVDAGQSGITYDSEDVVAYVSVTSGDSGSLTATVTYKKGDATEFTSDVPTFENTLTTTYTSVSVTKTWVGGTDGSVYVQLYRSTNGGTGEAYGPTLTLDGNVDGSFTTDTDTNIKFGEDAAWHGTFQNLPASDGTNTYSYSVKEVDSEGNETETPVDGYLSSISGNASSGYVITNTKLTSVSFEKNWNDGGKDHGSSDAVQVQLQKYNRSTSAWENIDGKVITLDGAADSNGETEAWKGSFTDLPTYESDGTTAIQYRVVETNTHDGYTYDGVTGNMSEGFVLTNTLQTSLTVTKEWVGSTGDSATFQLYRSVNGGTAVAVSGSTLTLTSDNAGSDGNWTGSFTGLPAYDSDGNLYTYSVQETNTSDDYVVTYGTTDVNNAAAQTQTVTNTKTTQVKVTKEWYGGTSTPVTINLMKQVGDDEATIAATLRLNGVADTSTATNDAGITMKEDSAWHGVFGNLPTMENGESVIYTVEEASVPSGFTSPGTTGDAASGFTIKNISTTKTNVDVTKVWKGTSEAVTINLYQDGTLYETVTLDGTADESMTTDSDNGVSYGEAESWVALFENLPKYNSSTGAEYTYTVDEVDVSGTVTTGEDAPSAVYSNLTSYTITNTRSAKVQPTVTKSWQDEGASKAVTLKLQRLDSTTNAWVDVESITLDGTVDSGVTADGTETGEYAAWQGRFSAVDKYDASGNEYSYQVVEATTGDWVPNYSGSLDDGFTVTNKALTSVSITKTWIDNDTNRPSADEFAGWLTLYADGKAVENAPVITNTDTDTWTITYSGLTKYNDNGSEIEYTIEEDEDAAANAGYAVSVDVNGNLTNTKATGSITLTGTKSLIGASTYNITFDANAGDDDTVTGGMAVQSVAAGGSANLTANTFVREGYKFVNWNTAADGSGTSYEDGAEITPTADMTLYAQWAQVYTITFDANAGSDTVTGEMADLQVVVGEAATLTTNAFTRDGYTFAGWNTAADGTGTTYADGATFTPTANTTLYAQWTQDTASAESTSETESETAGTTDASTQEVSTTGTENGTSTETSTDTAAETTTESVASTDNVETATTTDETLATVSSGSAETTGDTATVSATATDDTAAVAAADTTATVAAADASQVTVESAATVATDASVAEPAIAEVTDSLQTEANLASEGDATQQEMTFGFTVYYANGNQESDGSYVYKDKLAVHGTSTVAVDSSAAITFDQPLYYSTGTADGYVSLYDLVKHGSATYDSSTRTYTIQYYITEDDDENAATQANTQSIGLTVTAVDNQDGTLTVTSTMEETPILFTNRYITSSATVNMSGVKSISGNRPLSAGEFTFTLTGSDGAPMPEKTVVTNDAAGNVNFGDITYTQESMGGEKEKTYTYIIHEEHPDGATQDANGNWVYKGVTYAADQKVTVTVKDDGQGHLTATTKPSAAPLFEFVNTYTPTPGSASISDFIKITKSLTNGELTEGQFTFRLTNSDDGTYVEAKNDANGVVTFPAITFNKAGKYNFVLSEVNDGQQDVTYDEHVYRVIATVTDAYDGNPMTVTWSYGGETELGFVNEKTTSVEITKTWIDNDKDRPSAEEFATWLTLKDNNGNEVTGYTPTIVDNGGGKWTITYTGLPVLESGSYTVEEDEEAAANAGYIVTVDENGNLTNTLKEKPTTPGTPSTPSGGIPKTGDTTSILPIAFASIFGVALVALGGIGIAMHRRKGGER